MSMVRALLRRYWQPLAAIWATCALGIAVMVGLSGGCLSLEQAVMSYLDKYRYFDAAITTEVTADDKLKALLQVEGIAHAEARMAANTVIVGPSQRYLSVRAITYAPTDWQHFVVWESAPTGGRDAVLVEYEFALDNNIKAGDELQVRVDGAYRTCLVEALVSAPETLAVRALDSSSSLNSDFGYVYVPVSIVAREPNPDYDEAAQELKRQQDSLNEAQRDAQKSYEQALEEMEQAKQELERRLQEVYAAFEQIDEGRAALQDQEAEFSSYEALRTELEDALGQLREKRQELEQLLASLEQAKQALAQIDDGLDQAREMRSLLAEDIVGALVKVLKMLDPDTELSVMVQRAKALDEFRIRCAEAGFVPNVSGAVHDAAKALLAAMDTVESDRELLSDPSSLVLVRRIDAGDEEARESEQGRAIAAAVAHYTQEPLTETLFNLALSDCQHLYDLIAEYDLRGVAQDLYELSEHTYDEWLSWVMKLEDYATMLQELLGEEYEQITTVGQLLEAYERAIAKLEETIADLETRRADIIAQLEKAGVAEDGVDDAIARLRDSIASVDQAINEADAALRTLDSTLARARGELDAAEAQLDEAEAQAREGQATIASLDAQLRTKRQDAHSQWVQGLTEFSHLREELAKAQEELGEWHGYQAFHNQFLLWFDDGANPEETLAAAEAALAPTTIKSSYVFANSPVQERLDMNLVPLRSLSYFMPAVFFAVVLVVAFLFMSVIVRQSRTDIGILRALGKSTGQIRAWFCTLGLLVTIGAVPLGLILGRTLVGYTANYYADFFKLPQCTPIFDMAMLAVSVVLSIVVVQLATLTGTKVVSSIQPSESFSRAVPSAVRVPRVVEILTSHMDGLSKFSVVSLLRNPVRLVFSVLCIAASVAIILSAQSFIASKNYLIRQEFDQRLLYDCQVFFNQEPDEQLLLQLESLPYVQDVQRMGFYESTISLGDTSLEATLNAVQPNTNLVGIYDTRGQRMTVPEDGIVLDEHLAGELGAQVGDVVDVDGQPMRVAALSKQDVQRVQYLSLDSAQPLGESTLGCVICRMDSANQQQLLQELTERDDYVFAVFTDVLRESTEQLYATYDPPAWILTCFAIVIGALVIVNVMQTNLLERKRELCILRTLGFSHARVSLMLLCQTMLYVALAFMVGLPAGRVIAQQALLLISTPDRTFAYANGIREYAATVLITLGFAAVSHLLATHSMRRRDINEGMRDNE
ncbi:MAG: FtsX-like permease family protein [Atopobiaceae bacterium]|nr:FtsX-like permease family protein [Atopobiaceae bacterium]